MVHDISQLFISNSFWTLSTIYALVQWHYFELECPERVKVAVSKPERGITLELAPEKSPLAHSDASHHVKFMRRVE